MRMGISRMKNWPNYIFYGFNFYTKRTINLCMEEKKRKKKKKKVEQEKNKKGG
jgi:hypothetical protein